MSTSVDELTQKLQVLDLSDDLFPKHHTQTPLLKQNEPNDKLVISTLDALIIRKLELIDKYIVLKEQIDESLKDGFIDISRASYSGTSLNKPYGKDYWDGKVKAVVKVDVVNGKVIKKSDEVIDEKKKDLDDVKETGDAQLRNRKVKTKEKELKDEKEVKKAKKYDPINMFGVFVPYQLRQAQKSFKSSVDKIIELTNLIKDIEDVNSQLNELQDNNDAKKEQLIEKT